MSTTDNPTGLVPLAQAASLLGLRDERTVRRQLERHGLPLVRLGRSVRVERSALERLIAAARSPVRSAPGGESEIPDGRPRSGHPRRAMRRKKTKKKSNGRRSQQGWCQRVEPGLWRRHRIDCRASPERKRQPTCECPYACHHPTEVPGKTSLRNLKATTLTEARREKKKVQGEGRPLAWPGSKDRTLSQFFFNTYLKGRGTQLSPETQRTYTSRFKNDIEPLLGSKLIDEITPYDIQQLVQIFTEGMEERREELGRPIPTYVENRVRPVKAVLKNAHEIGRIARNPAAGIRAPRGRPRQSGERPAEDPQRVLSEEQMGQLYAHLRQDVAGGGEAARKAIGIVFGLFAALRIGEATGVWWSDVDLDEGTLRVERQWQGGKRGFEPTKTHATRLLALPEPAIELLRLYRLEEEARDDFSPDDALVYIKSPEKPMSHATLRRAFYAAQAQLGIVHEEDNHRFCFHALRHTVATTMIRHDVPIAKVSSFLGHKSTAVTFQVYQHLFPEDFRAAVAVLADVVTSRPPDPAPPRPTLSLEGLIEDILGGE